MTAKDYHAKEAAACYAENGNQCVECGKPAEGLAHHIPQRKTELDKFGWYLIHSRYNMSPSCNTCNAKLQIKSALWEKHAASVAATIGGFK